ncbi:MAG TPA: excinuclease ABC subunit UvrA [Vitreimonas sp.]|nr:excinuclease ABC subunit UvrA [Vitreimonas sp.]
MATKKSDNNNQNIQNYITVTGAREHNLKNVTLNIPKNQLVVFTGLSGSGKSSLAFDTLYAEGQRRYVESLSSYARQFLGVMSKPEVDQIDGLSPAISIDQKTTSHNPRSTVGTITEIYDYLRLLFARVGHPHCPNCGREIATQSIDQIVGHIMTQTDQSLDQIVRIMILSPVVRDRKGEFSALFTSLQKQGYSRVRIDGSHYNLADDLTLIKTNRHTIEVVLDRLSISQKQLKDESERKAFRTRISQSIEQALKLSDGFAVASFIHDQSFEFPNDPQDVDDRLFSEKLACSVCGISISELEPRLFSFNSPQGACPTCNGLGSLLKISVDKILAPSLTLSEGAIIPFAKNLSSDTWWSRLVETVVEKAGYDFRRTPFQDFDEETQHTLLNGSPKVYRVSGENRFGRSTAIEEKFEGFIPSLERKYNETESEYIRKDIEQYMQRQVCPTCDGARLKEEALSVTIEGKNISQITSLAINRALEWARTLKNGQILSVKERAIGDSILKEIVARLEFLSSVGLNYLSLHREASTLAGGEAQRIRLASQIGTGLTGVLYILDEPTIGLHQRDNHQLIQTLKNLRDKGNSVVVVEHDRDVMLASDYIFDFGPKAGQGGGQVVAEGEPTAIMKNSASLTGKYLGRKKDVHRDRTQAINGVGSERSVIDPDSEAQAISTAQALRISGATHHNLKGIEVDFPLNTLTCITGISGSGKSTLLHDTLYANLAEKLGKKSEIMPGHVDRISIPDIVRRVTLIDQSPIGKTPRSNPATYTKIFDYIRNLFTNTQEARMRGFNVGRFSFNVKGGRCEACEGEGQIKIEMQFLPDVYVDCDVCLGKRYNEETLQVTYKDKNIADVLKLSVDEAYEFFNTNSTLRQKLKTLQDVGLGYIELGQPAPTLSGGEAQRVKLAKELSGRTSEHVVYLLDEPTTGLHFADVQNLLNVLHQLVGQNNTVIVIEHNLDVIKNADWIIDLGPEGGEQGGEIVAVGPPEVVATTPQSFTGKYLQEELAVFKRS